MKVSLIMATIGRTSEVRAFLASLERQTYKKFELIVVDQNEDDRLDPILAAVGESFSILHIHSKRGLSLARNAGMNLAKGDVIAFPDDDCEYESDSLEKAVKTLNRQGVSGVVGVLLPPEQKLGSYSTQASNIKKINIYNVWVFAVSTTIFLKTDVIRAVGEFDILLGAGSETEFGSGEETDYLIRALALGYNIFHDNKIRIYHPAVDFNNPDLPQKAYYYSRGRRYVLEKHKYCRVFVMLNVYYPLVKLVFNICNFNKVHYFWYQFLGRWRRPV
jgi:glycosyltransferase involved in cell wall biosynthesis